MHHLKFLNISAWAVGIAVGEWVFVCVFCTYWDADTPKNKYEVLLDAQNKILKGEHIFIWMS